MKQYATFLLPPQELSEYVWTQRKKHATKFSKPLITPPHITLKESFGTNNIEAYIDELEEKIREAQIPPLPLHITGEEVFPNNYWVFNVEKTKDMQQLHEIVMHTAQQYVKEVEPYFPAHNLDEQQEEYLYKYNNPYSFEYYNPHLSIGKLKAGRSKPNSKLQQKRYCIPSVMVVNKETKQIHAQFPLRRAKRKY